MIGYFSYPITHRHYDPLLLSFIAVICLGIPSCSAGFIRDFLNRHAWIDVGSMMYMSGEAP